MANYIERDKNKRDYFLKFYKKRENLRLSLKNKEANKDSRYQNQIKLTKLNKNSLKVRLKNRCILTGRTHSVLKNFRISRIKLRDLISSGSLNGVKKSSW